MADVSIFRDPTLPGDDLFARKQFRRGFACFLCSSDDSSCPGPSNYVDATLQDFGVYALLLTGLRLAVNGRLSQAIEAFRDTAHRPIPSAIGQNPQSFLFLGVAEVAAGRRTAGVEHLIEASKRVGPGSPQMAPGAGDAAAAARVLLALSR